MEEIQDVNVEETTSGEVNTEEVAQEDTFESAGEQENTQVSEGEESSKVSKTVPYERFKEKVDAFNQMKEQMAALQAKAEIADRLGQAFNPVNPEDVYKQEQYARAKQELEQLGYVDKNTIDQLVEEKLNAYKWQERFVQQMDSLSKKYEDFKPEEVAKFMDEQAGRGNTITDPELAYKIMNMDKIVDTKAKAQKSSTFSEKPGGPVHEETDKRKSDLAAAAKTGRMQDFLKKYVSMPE